ncbi:unnamed protein product, partial [Ascophyllum nodosum]
TSAAAGGAADESTATQEAIDITPEAPEAASTTCFVEPAKVYNSTTGDLYDVSADTIAAINGFEAPSGFQEEGSREQSFLYSLGNYIKPIGVEEGGQYTGKFFCQVTKACRSANKIVPCKQGKRSNVNKHMLNKHSLRGQKGEDMCSTRKGKAGTIQAALGASKTFAVGTKRVRELQCAKLVVEKLLPFSFFSSGDMFSEIMATASEGQTTFPAMPPRR